jgi:hypothetical protein
MCGGGGGKSQTVYQQQLPGPLTDRMAAAADQAMNLAGTPFQAYGGPRVADMGWSQNAAIGTTAGLQGYVAPDVQAATAQGAQINAPGGWSIEGRDLSGYTNPWQEQVIGATMRDMDRQGAQASEAAAGQAIQAGAWGGSGGAIQQAELQDSLLRAKASTIAGLRSAGFERAQDMASADVSRGLQMATTQAGFDQQANLANMDAENRARLTNQQMDLQSAGVRQNAAAQQFQFGSVDQATRQAQMDVGYDEFLRQINDPFQKLQFGIGALTGVSPAFSTSTQTSRLASPSPWNAAAGLASIAAGAALFKDGGRVPGYMGGGGVPPQPRRAPVRSEDPEIERMLEELEARQPGAEVRPPVYEREEAPGGYPGMPAPEAPAAAGVPLGPPQPQQQAPAPAPSGAAPMDGSGVRLGLSLPGVEPTMMPAQEQAVRAGVPIDDATGRPSLRPEVAGLVQPLAMPSPAAYAVPSERGGFTTNDPVMRERLFTESGGNIRAMNARTGAAGAEQYMPSRLVDLGVYRLGEGEATRGANGRAAAARWNGSFQIPGMPDIRTIDDFRNSPEAQQVVAGLNRQYEDRVIGSLGLDRYVGQTIGGIEIRPADLRHVIHFAGADGASRFFSTGGRFNPSDGNMTVVEYLANKRRAGVEASMQGGGGRAQPMRGLTVPAGQQQAGGEDAMPAAQQAPRAGIPTEPPPPPEALDWWGRVRRGFRDPAHEEATLPMGLIAAGLGMMADPSPFVQQAVGRGGLMGVQFLQQARQQRGQDRANESTAAYRRATLENADRRARAVELQAERAGARDGVPAGYERDPTRPGAIRRIQGYEDGQARPQVRQLSPEEVEARGYQRGTVVTETVDARDGRVTGVQVEQQPRQASMPTGYEADPDNPGAIRRMPGFQTGNPLTPQAITTLSEIGGLLSTTSRLRSSFRDDYRAVAPIPGAGSIENWIGRNLGLGLHDQAQWWQDYNLWANQVRNQLFGSALTRTEQVAFDAAMINPQMTAQAIRDNLARQERAAATALRRTAAGYVRSGYAADAVAGALGLPVEEVEAEARRPVRSEGADTVPAARGAEGGQGGDRSPRSGQEPSRESNRAAAPPRPAAVGDAQWSPSQRRWWSRDRRNAWDEQGRPVVRDGVAVQ